MRRALAAFLSPCLLTLPTVREARGDEIDTCVAAASTGQKQEKAGQLRAARATFLSCDTAACPAEVRGVCDRLLGAVEANMPTVIFGARDAAGNDLVDVRVRVDGSSVAESMDGKALPLDPGPHALRFEHAGSAPIDQNVVIREAEKNRALVVTFSRATDRAASAPSAVGRRPVPALVYVFGGLGVASLGAFIGLDVDGQSRYGSCQHGGCSQSVVNSLSAERDATLVMAGVSVVSLALAAGLFLARPVERVPTNGLSFDVEASHGGGLLRAMGSF
jgi:hypothetical protein